MVLSCHEKISITLSDQIEYLNVDYIDCSLSKSILHVLFYDEIYCRNVLIIT
ncbi:hypothetical protein T4B_7870, partial [Trichinella pseudospiralis]